MATRLHESTADRISNLPDGAIERILVFLPIKDAARTSLLSRDWRHRWRSIPQLVFDDYFAPTPAGNSYLPDENMVMMQVYEALMGHDGPIAKFELSISGIRNPNVDILMRYISSKGVQELSLLFWECHHLQLYSSLFFALPLNRLKLQCCTFSLASSFVGFSKLNLVEFNDVFLPDNFYENFIPNCPLLEELRVFDCIGTDPVFVAPSLKVLLFRSGFEKICFKYTPLLSVVSVLDTDEFMYDDDYFVKHNPDMVSLFAALPALQHLNLGIELLLRRARMATRLRALTADRISNLPGDVIDLILVFLPIKDAVRTSLLSRSWRYRWRSIPQLVFDDRFAPLAENNPYGNLANEKEVVMKIYEALLAHDGLITKFELSIPRLGSDPPLDLLMLHLSSKGVQELILLFEDGDYPKLHSSLFSAAFPLKRLKLQRCEFKIPPWFVEFSNLTLLELEDVDLPDDFYQNFLPCCPLLEELRVISCTGDEHVFVAPSLKLLMFHSSLLKISFKYTPLLSLVSVLDTHEYHYAETSYVSYDPDMVGLFASLPALQHLNLGIELLLFLADGHVPYQLPTALQNLKFLEVPRILLHRLPQARVLVCLIMSAPNLERLTIRLDDSHEHPRSKVITSLHELLEAEDQPEVSCLQHLKDFNIQDGRGTQIELDLVRFVFATAPILRRISIKFEDKLCSKKILKFMKNAALCKRISREAELRYVFDDADEDEDKHEDEYEDEYGVEDESDN